MAKWRGALVAAALFALVPGCALPDEPADGAAAATAAAVTSVPATPVTSAPATEEATTPATESSGAGNSTAAQTTEPVVTVPQLPIGGGADDPGQVEQCVSVSFLGDAIPAGIAIVPEAVAFSEPLFELGGSECSAGDVPCLSGSFAFTAENDDTQAGICFLAVRATGERPAGQFDDVQLTLSGRLDCPPGLGDACELFARTLAADEQSISLTPRTAATTTTDATDTTPATTTTAATETEGTTGETTPPGEGGPPTD